ncbi:MAG: ADOP family duplicated permease, partial [Bryobacteraceae bacterium]
MRLEHWFYTIPLRLRTLFRRKHVERELDEELQFHLAQRVEQEIAAGKTPDEARHAALRAMEGVEQKKEQCRDARRVNWIEEFFRDLRYAFRHLSKSPGFTAVAILSLALGIGANTAIFSLINAVMLRDLPVKSPEQLVLLGKGQAPGSNGGFAYTELYSYLFYQEFRQQNQVFSGVSAEFSSLFRRMHGEVGKSSHLEPMNLQLVSGTYFSMLGVKPILGHSFTAADDEPAGGHPIAMISYSWWTRRFGRDPSILGRTITFGSTAYTIIGVTPPEFFGTIVGESPDLWIPLSMEKQISPGWNGLDNTQFQSLWILGRLKPGVSLAQARANVNVAARQIWRSQAGSVLSKKQQQTLERAHIQITPIARGLSNVRSEFSLPLKILMALVGLVLLIACANIANLLLARATARQREIAVRMAIGAGRARLVRQMLTESLLLAFVGGALGILFAFWAGHVLLGMVSAGPTPLPVNVSPDARVLFFTCIVSLVTALLFGSAPALRATRIDLTPALKEGRGAVSAASHNRLAHTLIVLQVALSLVLLIGAALFLRTLVDLSNVDTGFNKSNVLLFSTDAAAIGYKENSRLTNLYRQIEERVSVQPGVRAASVSALTFHQGQWISSVTVEGRTPVSGDRTGIYGNTVGPGYFATMGIPLLAGRVFNSHDTAKSPKVAVINETMARRLFPGASPIGRRFGMGTDPKHSGDIEVVGVVKDAKYQSLREEPSPTAYYPCAQSSGYFNDLEVRYAGDRAAIIKEVRRSVDKVDRNLPVSYQRTLAQQVEQSITSATLVAQLSTFFGLVALLLACLGIYGLMSYAVTRRTSEIGIRMALGAERSNVLWIVMRESLLLAGLGIAVGLPVA